jgi:hypothetical protein
MGGSALAPTGDLLASYAATNHELFIKSERLGEENKRLRARVAELEQVRDQVRELLGFRKLQDRIDRLNEHCCYSTMEDYD